MGTPEETFANGDSDHAPIALAFGRCFRPPTSDPPIPRWVCKHPNYKYHVDSLCASVSILNLEVLQQLVVYKKCLKEAAKRVRGECLFLDSNGANSAKLVLSSVSRALWFNNLSLAMRLIIFSAVANELIFIDKGVVCAHSYENFENTFGEFFQVYHRSEVVRLQADLLATTALTIRKQIKSRLQCPRRMQSVFWPSGKRLKL